MESNSYGSTLHLLLDSNTYDFQIEELAHQQIASRLNIPYRYCYRRLDNLELCAAVLPVINEMKNSVIESCEVTPTHLYLKVVNRRLKAEVKVGDVDEARFMLTVDKMREATQIPLKHDPVKSIELLADRFQLTENERGDILRQVFMGADNSRYGLLNAVTAASKIAKSYTCCHLPSMLIRRFLNINQFQHERRKSYEFFLQLPCL